MRNYQAIGGSLLTSTCLHTVQIVPPCSPC